MKLCATANIKFACFLTLFAICIVELTEFPAHPSC